jgi:hypothetical protein
MKIDADGTPRGPITYVIAYGEGLTTSDEWLKTVVENPPHLLHHGHCVPLSNLWGPTEGYSPWNPDHESGMKEICEKVVELRQGIERLHQAGVKWVIPYINPSIIGGDDIERTGFFNFWDRRDEFAEIGLDMLPDDDPMDWMQRNWFSFAPYKSDSPYRRFEPCLRREAWLKLLETCAGLTSEAGYDGVFSDDDLVQCHCPVCMTDFREFLKAEYADRMDELTKDVRLSEIMLWSDDGKGRGPAMRRPTSGILSHGPAVDEDGRPVDPWGTLVWQASQAFWSQTIGDMLKRVRDAGRTQNSKFFVVPNWGMTQNAKELRQRRELGHDFRRWQPGGVWQMLEEEASAGYIAPGFVSDFWTLCRAVAAHDAEPVLLAYSRAHAGQKELGYAEVASANCGAYADGKTNPLLSSWRRFLDDHEDLFADAVPYAPVGLLYSFDEITANNEDHLRLCYAVSRALGRAHIPYDLVSVEGLGDREFEVVINPGAVNLPEGTLDDINTITLGPDGINTESVIGPHEIALDAILALPMDECDAKLVEMSSLDLTGTPLLADMIVRTTGHGIVLTGSTAANAVRLRTYTTADDRLVIHVVNYGCTSMTEDIPVPGKAPSFPLRLPLRDGVVPTNAYAVAPDCMQVQLLVLPDDVGFKLAVPATEVYRAIVVEYA